MKEHQDGYGVGEPADEGPNKGIKKEGQDLHEFFEKRRVGHTGFVKTIRAFTASKEISFCIVLPLCWYLFIKDNTEGGEG